MQLASNRRLQGIFTERDLLKRVVAEGFNPDSVAVDDAVVKGDRVEGLVSRRDLRKLDIELLEEELDRGDPATLFL